MMLNYVLDLVLDNVLCDHVYHGIFQHTIDRMVNMEDGVGNYSQYVPAESSGVTPPGNDVVG